MSKLRKVEGLYYDLELPRTDKKLKYRAMKVKETKLLLTAIGMNEENATVNAILDIVESATRASFPIRELPMHLIDLIFLKIYTKSSGGQTVGVYKCGGVVEKVDTETEEVTTEACDLSINIPIDLEKANLVFPEEFKEKTVIEVGEDQSICLKIPSLEGFKKMKTNDISAQYIFSGIEAIVEGDDVKVPGQDFDVEELNEWLDELDGKDLQKITEFFKQIPQLGLDVPVTCPKCGRKEEFELRGLEDFFL